MAVTRQPHLTLKAPSSEDFGSIGRGGGDKTLPLRDREAHAKYLLGQIELIRHEAMKEPEEPIVVSVGRKDGLHVQFELERPYDDALRSLEDQKVGIDLVAVKEIPAGVQATVYVPPGKLQSFEKKLRRYTEEDTKKGRPKHEKLVATINAIRLATVRELWTDADMEFPEPGESVRWEVWIRRDEQAIHQFEERAPAAGLELSEKFLEFPDRRVYAALGTLEQMMASVEVLDAVAEFRLAKESREFFIDLRGPEAKEWVDDLRKRIVEPPDDAPAVCLLDSGLNAGHALIRPFVEDREIVSARPEWDPTDSDPSPEVRGHGTKMAGLCLYGDLSGVLAGSGPVEVHSRLESVRILNSNHPTPEDLHGVITRDAVNQISIVNPDRPRVFSMSVTTKDGRDRGQPSSWSAEVDQLASGTDDDAADRRLFIISAGNSREDGWKNHPDHLATEMIRDPGQAWNALTVGSCTRLWEIEEEELEGWTPLCEPGDLSASTSTSMTWKSQWPLKPDIVMEGGNCAIDPDRSQIDKSDSLSLLTTSPDPIIRPFVVAGETSAACSLAARLAARVQAEYPEFWPETIRGLLVHSAEWTVVMKDQYLRGEKRRDWEGLVRYCGFGEPSEERALWSAGNHLTLISESELTPFQAGTKNNITMNEMHLHEIPWPREVLRDLGEAEVELKITLSYFIEPNPARRGWTRRHRYSSHGLRYDINTPEEKPDEFRARINKVVRESEEGIEKTESDSSEWELGPDLRGKGSLHSDTWRGTAVDLASRTHIGVFPVGGWWKERPRLERWNRAARYSLIVSVRTPVTDVDLYTPIKLALSVPVEIEV